MKFHKLYLSGVILSAFVLKGNCQDVSDLKAYNNFTFYYIDNSEGYDASELNEYVADELKNNIKKLGSRPDNYFLLFACNGEEYKMSTNLQSFIEQGTLRKYLAKSSKESDYFNDKQAIRENLTEYPVRIKQNVEINMYLSSAAVKKIGKNTEEIPAPIVLPDELLLYLNSKELKVKMNIYINKEVTKDISEEKIKQYFSFCEEELNKQKAQTEFYFL